MKLRRLVTVCLTALLAAGAAAHAQPRGGARTPPPAFEAGVDEGEDEGPRKPRQQLFISPFGQPFRVAMDQPYPSAVWFAAADANHDGRLTREEFRADAEAYFKVLDANGDGKLSMPEATRWEEELVPEVSLPTFGGYGGGRGGPLKRNQIDTRAQGASTYSLINEPHPVRGADADFSMSVSLAEWRAAADRRFALLDVDGDGAVLPTDLPATPAQKLYARQPGKRDKFGGVGERRGPR